MVTSRFLWELEALCALSVSQFGFRQFRSTSDLSLCLSIIFVKPLRRKRSFLGHFLTLKRHMILHGGEMFFVNCSILIIGDSSLYLSKTFYLNAFSKYVFETTSLITLDYKR